MTSILERHGAVCDAVGEDVIFEWRAGGASTREIRRRLGIMHDGAPIGDGTGGGVRGLYRWLHATPERWAAWQEAGRHAAEGLTDEALDIADSGGEDTTQRDRLRVDQRRYMAERLDPMTFAKPTAGAVTINLGGLHLSAVRGVQAEMQAERTALRLGSGAVVEARDVEREPETVGSLERRGGESRSPHTDTGTDSPGAATAVQYATLLD